VGDKHIPFFPDFFRDQELFHIFTLTRVPNSGNLLHDQCSNAIEMSPLHVIELSPRKLMGKKEAHPHGYSLARPHPLLS